MPHFLRLKKTFGLFVLLFVLSAFEATLAQVPVIMDNAKDTFVCQGVDVTFTISASNNPTGYQWQHSYLDENTWSDISPRWNIFSGANTNSVTVHTANFAWGAGHMIRCIASNADGSSIPSATHKVRIANPHPDFTITGSYDFPGIVCLGSTNNNFETGMNYDIDSVIWSYSGTGARFHRDYAALHSIRDSSITIDFSSNATPGILSARDSNACGIYTSLATPISIGPPPSTVAGVVGYGTICNTLYYSGFPGLSFTTESACAPISVLATSGSNPVFSNVKSCVEMDATVQSFNGIPYVQRHYNIEPQDIDGSTSTATLTLYFTQDDFNAYNLARGANPALPINSTDAAGVSNLRVTQFHGTGTDPGTYVGGSGGINPDDNNVVWNASASRWEVTFDIIGFSGFFVSGGSLTTPLPLTLISFTGQSVTGGNLLRWTTSYEENTRNFEVQRNDGNGFKALATVPAATNSHQNLNYSYLDPLSGNAASSYTYRLKMIDIDGKFTYSKTIELGSSSTGLSIRILPNPFDQPQSLTVSSGQPALAVVTVTDIGGKALWQQPVSLQKGENTLDPAKAKIAALPQGMYLLSVTTDWQKQTVKFIKK